MKYRIIQPRNLTAKVNLPASKSISNRALIMNAMSGAQMGYISNLSSCDDTRVMLETLFIMDEERCQGRTGQLLPTINIKAAGTAMRFLTAFLAASPDSGTRVITGTERMRHRPIGVLVEALRKLGAEIEYVEEEGYPPLRITGTVLHGTTLELPGTVSSQFVSALLMVGPWVMDGLTLKLKGEVLSRPYINMTIKMMQKHGADVKWKGQKTIVVAPDHPYLPTPYLIESDWSAASYWYEICLLSGNRNETLSLMGLFPDSLQGDSAVAEIFEKLAVQSFPLSLASMEPRVMLLRRGRMAKRIEWDFSGTPDLAQTLVVTCAMKGVSFRFTGLQSLRIKETDRIDALQRELRKLGVQVEVEGDDTMTWAGPTAQAAGDVPYLQPAEGTAIDTYEDHRMAMAFAPAAMVLGSIDINDPEVVSKSYPNFWKDLEASGFEVVEMSSDE